MVDIHEKTLAEHFAKPEHIIVATDLNDLDLLLPHAICQAKAYSAQLTFIHSLSPQSITAGVAGTGREECAAQEQMDVLLSRVEAERISCNSEIAYAFSPEDALSQAARRLRRSRLIMATHGRGRLGQIMLGSVARELLAFFDIPIFAVGPNVGLRASYCNPKRIICPVSFSNRRKATVEFALRLAEAHQAELMLMHVNEPGTKDEIEPERMRRLTVETGLVFSTQAQTHIAYGNVAEEILNTARIFDADWLILGTSPIAAAPMSYTPLSATNKAYSLMATANIPVLTFPHRVRSMASSISKDSVAAHI